MTRRALLQEQDCLQRARDNRQAFPGINFERNPPTGQTRWLGVRRTLMAH